MAAARLWRRPLVLKIGSLQAGPPCSIFFSFCFCCTPTFQYRLCTLGASLSVAVTCTRAWRRAICRRGNFAATTLVGKLERNPSLGAVELGLGGSCSSSGDAHPICQTLHCSLCQILLVCIHCPSMAFEIFRRSRCPPWPGSCSQR